MKKIIFLTILTFLFSSSVKALDTDLTPNSKSAVLMSFDTGEILYQKNENEALAPASMTKIMSMLLIMEAIDNKQISMDSEVVISQNASSMGGSQVFLNTGETYKVEELLKGIAIASGNDAVVAMAEKVAGSEAEFVKLMNDKAKELGLTSTTFKNPHGLDAEGHVSSALDMAKIAKELLKHEKILEFTSIYEDYLKKKDGSSVWLVNTNKLVRFYNGADGLKTGYTSTAGYCLTSTAKKNNTRFITVVMGVETSEKRSEDTTNLLNYAFNTFSLQNILDEKHSLGKKKVENSLQENVDIVLVKDYTKLMKNTEEKPNYTYHLTTQNLVAPINKGDVIGNLNVIDEKGNTIDILDVTVKEDILETNFLEKIYMNIKRLTSGRLLLHDI